MYWPVASVAEVVFREGDRIIPLARCGHLIRYRLEWSLYFLVSIRLFKKIQFTYHLRVASGRSFPCIEKNEQEMYCTTRVRDECYACLIYA